MENNCFKNILKCITVIFIINVIIFKIENVQSVDVFFQNMLLRLNNSRPIKSIGGLVQMPREGRVEVSFDFGESWGTICSTSWSLREGNVVCKQLGLGYAAKANQSQVYGNSTKYPWSLVGTLCRGNEKKLSDCFREANYPQVCSKYNRNIATVSCIPTMPDLKLGIEDIEWTARLDIIPLSKLTCAMEENCLAKDAYDIRQTNPHALRRLLRFVTKADNVGTADFSPYNTYEQWQWHQCHAHYHSMENFASFDIYDFNYTKMAQGHKASFCLMDTMCQPGVQPIHNCGNRTQGISVGCADVYTPDLDCQWVDVTNLIINRYYILRVALNPEYKMGEISFENNGAECVIYYTGETATTKIIKCIQAPLWLKTKN